MRLDLRDADRRTAARRALDAENALLPHRRFLRSELRRLLGRNLVEVTFNRSASTRATNSSPPASWRLHRRPAPLPAPPAAFDVRVRVPAPPASQLPGQSPITPCFMGS
ncbi:hypothetical protein [Streptomyces sp. NPDC056512]|uniref:hypothetical protein n=1 Tax=Streptomyces sp. NPDC056512 TaxID=3345846 RepID=UPI00368EBC94